MPPESERRFEISCSNNINYEYIGAYLLGKYLQELLDKSEVEIVKNSLMMEDGRYSNIIQRLTTPTSENTEDIYNIFAYFKKGVGVI